jgi:hypothetical protein
MAVNRPDRNIKQPSWAQESNRHLRTCLIEVVECRVGAKQTRPLVGRAEAGRFLFFLELCGAALKDGRCFCRLVRPAPFVVLGCLPQAGGLSRLRGSCILGPLRLRGGCCLRPRGGALRQADAPVQRTSPFFLGTRAIFQTDGRLAHAPPKTEKQRAGGFGLLGAA